MNICNRLGRVRIVPIALAALLSFAFTVAALAGQKSMVLAGSLSVTFTNPTPGYGEEFGSTAVAVGTDRLLIGGWRDDAPFHGEGAAYLYSTNGTLLTRFTNPNVAIYSNSIPQPSTPGNFGSAIAALGTDRVIIGAAKHDVSVMDDGVAFLFSTDGTLLTTFTNPTPARNEWFGLSVAAVGTDKVLIGVPFDNYGPVRAGTACLFNTNGALLRTFTNFPSYGFGIAVAALGSEHVLIGVSSTNPAAYVAGIVQLFNVEGSLVTSFTNPAPLNTLINDRFGWSVAPCGDDKVLVGAYAYANSTGQAYLFATNGTLLITFTNPAPSWNDEFGRNVAALGSDKVLISAHRDGIAGEDGGVVYVFHINGSLLATVSNPKAPGGDFFGYSIATLGTNRFAAGAICRWVGSVWGVGAAYIVNVDEEEVPMLRVETQGNGDQRICWPLPASGFLLETTLLAVPPATNNWTQVPFPYETNATHISITVTPAGSQFYRLRKP
jgi:hypothetical protein